MRWFLGLICGALLGACAPAAGQAQPLAAGQAEAVFAGGCFWCVESDFEHLEGVIEAESGYTGGARRDPSYRDHEGHVEAVRVIYDPARISYGALLNHFWRHHDPLDGGGQFCDRGSSYAPAIFVSQAQRAEAERSKAETERILGRTVATPVRDVTRFWRAEDYHQDYYRRNAAPYHF